MITEAERAAAEYLLSLPKEDRQEAAARISQLVKAKAAPAEAKPRIPVTRFADYREQELPVPPFLLPSGQLVRGELHALIARAGKGKTTLTMNRIIRWSAGLPLFDELAEDNTPIGGPLKILMLQNEGVAYFMQEKLRDLAAANAGLTAEQSEYVDRNLFIWGDGGYSNFKVDKEGDLEILRRALEEVRPDVLTLEPFRGIWRGEENDSTAMEAVLDDLVAIAYEYQTAIMLGHHERKGGVGEDGEWMSASRGSGNLEGKVAAMENLRSIKDGEFTELSWSKRRYSTNKLAPVRMEFNHNTWRLSYVPEDQLVSEILAFMHEDAVAWYTTAEIVEALNESKATVWRRLKTLVDDGRIVKKKAEGGGDKFRLKTDDAPAPGGGLEV